MFTDLLCFNEYFTKMAALNSSWIGAGSSARPRYIPSNLGPPPLVEMPHMWQPNLHAYGPYHCSHSDLKSQGWVKWSAEHPDWYATTSHQYAPDWYQRKIGFIRDADTKYTRWHWDQASRPTQRKMFGSQSLSDNDPRPEVLQPRSSGYTGTPERFYTQVPVPKWGLYHPPHYEDPCRFDRFPPIKDHYAGLKK